MAAPTYPRWVTPAHPAEPDHVALPLFPLGTVLFPGLVMPLHVFEDRYRSLIRYIMDLPDGTPREFGVVAIRRGWEVDAATQSITLYDVGCTTEVRQITDHPDRRFDIVTVVRRRFKMILMTPPAAPYLQVSVRYLPQTGCSG